MASDVTRLIAKFKKKLSKETPHNHEDWGQDELRQVKDAISLENYSADCAACKAFSDWIDNQ